MPLLVDWICAVCPTFIICQLCVFFFFTICLIQPLTIHLCVFYKDQFVQGLCKLFHTSAVFSYFVVKNMVTCVMKCVVIYSTTLSPKNMSWLEYRTAPSFYTEDFVGYFITKVNWISFQNQDSNINIWNWLISEFQVNVFWFWNLAFLKWVVNKVKFS